ncbi:MAG: Uridine phosphorylase [Chloroflexi bacterium ADurb.Bin120]|jgi:uridine phosphorylase|uniref:Uridine phosphorylase n=1 Tax=Candidatus Brevifilum fermentans TaxID=1986204 RepID=A0A1Y6K670_9CHLR|nr:nucleoside phosphorylase [Brevefilum fermentans]MDI9565307.1 nucleoside phosphorylase [Chloroflexota bacterium]OQB87310.1 MAG: Uridine phosphorylase [Chloroflexi bacterium ADurb.Bin120]SMX53520.1 Uridine phosphorylase [Brevefilum fermentans]HOM67959.1 nucleoside phosphorylase [Brevefilum fermentans]HPX95697.1 nucleoside phosphorylase [Brevefilum fermentans]
MDKVKHLHITADDVGRYVFLPGDPARCDKIAQHFEAPKLMAFNREYKTITGTLLGEKVSVVSTGIGNPSAAIAVEELHMLGCDTFIRTGTSGAMQPECMPGDLGIIKASVRDEGTTKHHMPIEFPAIANLDMVLALLNAAKNLGFRSHVGISHCKDSFYGQMKPEEMPVASELLQRWNAWVRGGVLCAEMESATLFTLGAIYRLRTASIVLLAMNHEYPHLQAVTDVEPVILTAIEAMKTIIKEDQIKEHAQP